MMKDISKWKKLKNWLTRFVDYVTPQQATLKAAGIGILASSLLFFTLASADGLLSSVGFGYYFLHLLIYLLVAYIAAFFISGLVRLVGKTPRNFREAIAFTLFFIFYFIWLGPPSRWTLIILLTLFPALIFGALYYWKTKVKTSWLGRQKFLTILSLFIGVFGLGFGYYFYFYAGSPQTKPKNYKMLAKLPDPIEASNPGARGKFKVAFLSYGSGKDKHRSRYGKEARIKTPSVDASFLIKSWEGISGKLRTQYFGFDQTELPLNAMVWYPEDLQTPAPLVLIVHGNHLAQDWSEGGYDYLGELLASKGYIVASVDENFLNGSFTDLPKQGLKEENGLRAWLMLKHLELWRTWNQDAANPFFNRVNMDQIALMGHSRGGEAMSHAALFNTLPYFPDNANEVFHFNFNIKAYIAIAPVDGQYQPAAILTPLQDINYFVIQGTHDMDMQSYGGLSTYKRIRYSPDYRGFKAGLYVHQANHGQFNTSWGKYDASSPYINQFNMTNLMPANEQEQIAKVYIGAFLDVHLKGDSVYKPLFVDYRYGRKWLPNHLYFNQFEDSEVTFIARYEEDLNLTTATLPQVHISTEHLSVWREAQQNLMWKDHLSRAVYIGWNREQADSLLGKYTFHFDEDTHLAVGDKALVFSLAESDESSSHIKKGKKNKEKEEKEQKKEKSAKKDQEKQAIDFTIELTDQEGVLVRFPLSDCAPLQPQLKKNLTKFAFLNDNADAEAIPDFFYFDLHMLHKKYPTLDLNSLASISFVFDQSPKGVVILDDIGFMRLPSIHQNRDFDR